MATLQCRRAREEVVLVALAGHARVRHARRAHREAVAASREREPRGRRFRRDCDRDAPDAAAAAAAAAAHPVVAAAAARRSRVPGRAALQHVHGHVVDARDLARERQGRRRTHAQCIALSHDDRAAVPSHVTATPTARVNSLRDVFLSIELFRQRIRWRASSDLQGAARARPDVAFMVDGRRVGAAKIQIRNILVTPVKHGTSC